MAGHEHDPIRTASAVAWSDVATAESSLVARCVVGDDDACRELVDTHQPMVFQLAHVLLGDREEALDLSQEVFLRVFRTLGSFRGDASLRTWIYRIAINQARNRRRWWARKGRAVQVSLDEAYAATNGEPMAPPAEGAEVRFERQQLVDRMRRAIATLPFDLRTVLILRELHGMRYQEIAFSLGVTVGAVKSRLARARAALRRALKEVRPC